LKTAQSETISERIYCWSLQQATEKFERNCAFVKSVKGTNAEKYIRFFQQIHAPDVPVASQALVKRMNQPVLLGKKTVLTDFEDKYVQAYLRFEVLQGPDGTTAIMAEQSTAIWTVELRRALKSLVKERFRAETGAIERVSPDEWIHEVEVGSIRIRTWLDFGGRSCMSYNHRLSHRDGGLLSPQISLLQWLGAASKTSWRDLRAEELMDAADAVLAVCKYFIQEMKILFPT
jgi:hypothetical protein